MLEITRRIEWDMAHRLGAGYTSKCKYLHGHRYVAEVSFRSPGLNKFGMILDFGDIKDVCKYWIDEWLDHGCLVFEGDTELEKFLVDQRQKYYKVAFNTTVENITPWLAALLQEEINMRKHLKQRQVKLTRLRVYETPNGWAEWRLDE